MLKDRFPGFRYRSPASEAAIAKVEKTLRFRFPNQLRAMYLETDGFRENIGNSKYLLSLSDEDGIGSLVGVTRGHWGGIFGFSQKKFRSYVFFGVSGANYAWGINASGTEIIRYHHHMEGEYEVVGESIIEVYERDLASYPA